MELTRTRVVVADRR